MKKILSIIILAALFAAVSTAGYANDAELTFADSSYILTSVIMENDMETEPFAGFSAKGGVNCTHTAEMHDEEHGQSIKIVNYSADNWINPRNTDGYTDVLVFEAEFLFDTSSNVSLFMMKSYNPTKWNMPYQLNNDGTIKNAYGEVVATGIDFSVWHKYAVLYDIPAKTASLYIDDVLIEAGQPLKNVDFEGITYVKIMAPEGRASSPTQTWMDNVRVYAMTGNYDYSVKYENSDGEEVSSESVPYENAKAHVTFTRNMNAENIGDYITVTDKNGNSVAHTGTYNSDTRTYTLLLDSLTHNSEYTISVSEELKTLNGGIQLREAQPKTFKTDKLPFCFDEISVADNGENVKVTVRLRNITEPLSEGVIIAGVYKDGAMYDAYTAAAGAGNSDYEFELTNLADSQIKLYLLGSDIRNVIDAAQIDN